MTAHESFHDDRVTLYAGDCLSTLDSLPETSVDACVCDPPYHLTSIVKRFAKTGRTESTSTKSGPHQRTATGFMGKSWDGGDIAFRSATWAKVFRVLKPGAYIVAFSSSRTFGRMSVAIEDAGFITHPMIGWLFGTGFPKATRIQAPGYEGQRYGAQALKPSLEPIYVGQKPFSEATGTANILRWGTSALRIDDCRVGTDEVCPKDSVRSPFGSFGTFHENGGSSRSTGSGANHALGRWPPNLCHDGSPEVLALFPETGVSSGGPSGRLGGNGLYGEFAQRPRAHEGGIGDSGSAARFFPSFPLTEADCALNAPQKDCQCGICGVLFTLKEGSDEACVANIAQETSSTLNTREDGSAHSSAAERQPRESADRSHREPFSAGSADPHLSECPPPTDSSALQYAPAAQLLKIVRNAKSVASLCDSCATDIARALVAAKHSRTVESIQFPASISERNAQILRQSLAVCVASQGGIDTITTTASLKTLFGCAFLAIANTTPQNGEHRWQGASERLKPAWYSSKAGHDDRLGSKHATVKPLDLMRWLVRLHCPKGGLVIDPFAGTGTTGHAALIEGCRAILCEADSEHCDDIRRRMGLVYAGRDERARKLAVRSEAGPLFGALA